MDRAPQSQTATEIELLLRQLEPGTERYTVLDCAKHFKSSWVELGQQLQTVRHQRRYIDWGYTTFEDYCAREIRIRRQTADKLTMAFHYLQQKNPALAQQNENLQPVPDFRSIDLLRQADSGQNFTREQQQELERAVFDNNLSHPTVAKRFREMALEVAQPTERQCVSYKSALSAARRLQTALTSLPEEFMTDTPKLDGLIDGLEQAIELLQPQEGIE